MYMSRFLHNYYTYTSCLKSIRINTHFAGRKSFIYYVTANNLADLKILRGTEGMLIISVFCRFAAVFLLDGWFRS